MLGIMYVTGFLSLWIQNTAAASMMLPIVIALVKQLSKYNKAYSEEPNHHLNHNHANNVFPMTTGVGGGGVGGGGHGGGGGGAHVNVAYKAEGEFVKTNHLHAAAGE